jgi:hypothetical protein
VGYWKRLLFQNNPSKLLKSGAARVVCEHLLSSWIVRTAWMNVFCLDIASGYELASTCPRTRVPVGLLTTITLFQ